MLNLTSDIAIAAFFATTRCENGAFYPQKDGIGLISYFCTLMGMELELLFHIVGLQPFQRPGKQCAFGVKLDKGKDLNSLDRGNL